MSRIAICNYVGCNGIRCNAVGRHAVKLAKRGMRNAFFCDYHFDNLEGYTAENMQEKGTEKKHGFTFATEFETSSSTKKARMELIDVGYVPTYDCTVDCEYKSPIYDGLNALSKHCATIDRLQNNGQLRIGHECGTHFHVGHKEHINAETMEYIRRFYHSLFIPLCEEMKKDSEKTAKFWGRDFTGYAQPIDRNTWPKEHENFINTQHNPTLEFRLCKFVTADQYMNCAKFCRDVVNAVINNFVLHFNDECENETAYRTHKAQVTAQKIVKLYNKYTANL